jgi:hypothetical protein
MRRLPLALPALLAIGLVATACAGATSAPASSLGTYGRVEGMSQPGGIATTDASAFAAKGAPAVAANGMPGQVPVPAALEPDRMLIQTASISMRAKDPWASADRAQAIATGLGGDVMGLSQSGAGDQRSANLTLRVPSARFNDALRQLRDMTDVEVLASGVDAKDVTDQFVDLDARLTAKKSEEQRYLALLARADKVDDILKIDQALSSVRTQVEQLTGQLNSIKKRTDFSTITVGIAPLAVGLPSTPGTYDPAKTAQVALATLVSLFRVVADFAIWALIFGWIPVVLLALALALQRGRRPTATTTA